MKLFGVETNFVFHAETAELPQSPWSPSVRSRDTAEVVGGVVGVVGVEQLLTSTWSQKSWCLTWVMEERGTRI